MLLLAVGAVGSVALVRSSDAVVRLTTGYGPASDANSAALTYMLDAETGIRGYALTGRPAALRPYRQAVSRIVASIDSMTAALAHIGDHALDGLIATERGLAQTWIDKVARPSVVSVAAAKRATETPAATERFDTYRASNSRITQSLDASRRALRREAGDQRYLVFPIVIAAVIAALVLAGVATWRTAKGVSRPLTALWGVVRRLESGDLTARADESVGPAEVRDVATAVNLLATDRGRALDASRADDARRHEMRELTAAIRVGRDPDTMARALAAGLGRVFAVDRVWVQTFDDPRVPRVCEQWSRDDPMPEREPADPAAAELLRGLASRLWHSGSVVGIADHRQLSGAVDPRIALAPQAGQARASAIAAIGQGRTAIGLLWLAVHDSPRTWASSELGMLQHLAGEVAQNLAQSHALGQQMDALRKLREADEAKTALISTVSHELRTPLTSIIGYLDLLLDTDAATLPPVVVEMLHVIERNSLRLRELIEDLLTQSQIEAGRRTATLAHIDLVDVLDDVGETIAPLAEHAGLELEMTVPRRGVLIVNGDARQLGQAITNLVANAVKFTPPGGQVTVTARRMPGEGSGEARVRISDTGMGIPPGELPQLFGRFFRASNARAAVIPGTGLGLAIVHEIVAQHRGTIDVESELGTGSTFVIRLPTAEARSAERADARLVP